MNRHIAPHLRREEGFRSYAYKDHLGFWTIGFGRLIDHRKGGGITWEEGDYLLSNDITSREVALAHAIPWYNDLDPVRQAVLLSMAYQMGIDGLLGFKNTLARVSSGDYAGAAEGMLHSRWALQTPARADRLSHAMRTGEAQWLR